VQDDPTIQGYNVDEWVDKIVEAATHQSSQTKTNHQMWMLGNDFTFQSASRWFGNYDKLIHYVNLDGRIRIFYSTPSNYVKAKHFYGSEWEVRTSDLFPLADGPHEYWTGYFTSRPSLKRQYRYASAFLQSSRQIETLLKLAYSDTKISPFNDSEARTSTSPLGIGWTDELEGALAVVAHHDGVSGTARQSVTNDYSYRLALGSVRAERAALQALEKIAQITPGGSAGFCNCNSAGPKDCLLNMSSCSFTSSRNAFTVVLWNPLARPVSRTIDIPVRGWKFHVRNEDGTTLPSSLTEIDPTTKGLPLRYLNDHGLAPAQIWEQLLILENPATHRLLFPITIPGLGYRIVRVSSSESMITRDEIPIARRVLDPVGLPIQVEEAKEESILDIFGLENNHYKIEVDPFTNRVLAIVNKKLNYRFPFEIEWGYYRSSIGGCSKEKPELDACLSQASGAYLFRPNNTNLHWSTKKPIYSKIKKVGSLIEVQQKFASWISHTLRLDSNSNSIQVEWTVGPIPIEDDWGKEIVVRYRSSRMKSNGKFYTDSNGREMVERIRNTRSNDVCIGCKRSLQYEPVSSNYYPVNSYISVHDEKHEFTVLVDATHGGTSLRDGEIELMAHRRVLKDDFRGVEEPLNETMCGCGDIHARPGEMGTHGHLGDGGCLCEGLTIRGRHLLVLDSLPSARKFRRTLGNEIANPPQLAFFENDIVSLSAKVLNTSAIMKPNFILPESVHMLTLCSNYENGTLVRFSHSFERNEHPELSDTVTFSMKDMFRNKIKSSAEYSLSGNQPVENIKQQHQEMWSTPRETGISSDKHRFKRGGNNDDNTVVTLRPMEVKTYWVKFEDNK
jgi:alpha-mannosidase